MATEQLQPTPKRKMTGLRVFVWALVVIAAAYAVFALVRAGQVREDCRRINCAGNLKGIGLTLRMYSADNNECFPDDLLPLTRHYLTAFQCYVCPSTGRAPAPSAQAFDLNQHCDYLYFCSLGFACSLGVGPAQHAHYE